MTPKRFFFLQTLLEAAIPIAGYFYWHWDLSFILLFYLLDWILASGVTVAKGLKRTGYSKDTAEKRLLVKAIVFSMILLFAACALIAIDVVQLHPGLRWMERIWKFLTYKDMGFAQGYALVPLILLNGIMLYRQQFLIPARYRTHTVAIITQPLVRQGLVIFGSAALLLGILQFTVFPEEVLIFLSITAISVYRLLVLRS